MKLDLHDSTLLSISLDWGRGEVVCVFRTGVRPDGLRSLKAEGVTQLTCPRRLPWGPSISVNSATVEELALGVKVIIEMQSGDGICILCERASLM